LTRRDARLMGQSQRHVLAELPSPIGVLHLVAYRQDGLTWVGIARGDAITLPEGGLIEAVGLRTGSQEMRINASVSSTEGFSYASGAVSPEIVKAEIRDPDGRVFPATIVDIPDEIEEEYRAVWAILEEVHDEGRVIGYDERGHFYDETDPRVFGPPPTTDERLEAIRQHAHGSIRYLATAISREPEEYRRWLEAQLAMAATFMALLEADATDTRTMLARREKILERYMDDAKSDPWLPPEPD
jgi:hypothetical protein